MNSHILWALVFAAVAGVIIHYVYTKRTTMRHILTKFIFKSKSLQETVTIKEPRTALAKLILPDNREIKLTRDEKSFGREDFLGVISGDDLLFIGRRHFKIVVMDGEFYIEDLDTKNGTMLNGEEIKGLGRKKLKNGDEILAAKVLMIKYVVKSSYIENGCK